MSAKSKSIEAIAERVELSEEFSKAVALEVARNTRTEIAELTPSFDLFNPGELSVDGGEEIGVEFSRVTIAREAEGLASILNGKDEDQKGEHAKILAAWAEKLDEAAAILRSASSRLKENQGPK